MNEIGALEREARERQFVVRAVLSGHVPLAGPMAAILTRPSYHLMSVNNNLLTIFLHHGGVNAAFFNLVGSGPDGALAYIGVEVESRFPSNCFWAARTAVSQLFELGCRYSGQVLSYTKMLGQLQDAGNTTTLAHYLELLAGAGMLTGLQKYAGGSVRQRGSSPKLQVLNTALMTAQSGLSPDEAQSDREFRGRLWSICNLLRGPYMR